MQTRTFHRGIVVHLSHEEKVEFGAGIQPVPDHLADHWHVLANSSEDGDEQAGEAAAEPIDTAALASIEADLAAEKAKVAALEANASEFEKTLADRVAERDAAVAERDTARDETEVLQAEITRLGDALAKAEADLEAATAPKAETSTTEAKPHGARKGPGK